MTEIKVYVGLYFGVYGKHLFYLFLQFLLVVFDHQYIIGLLLNNLRRNSFLATHGINRDNAIFNGKQLK